MTEQIIERIGRRVNDDIQEWYQDKVNKMAYFLVRKIKEDTAALKKIRSNECKELEVMTK